MVHTPRGRCYKGPMSNARALCPALCALLAAPAVAHADPAEGARLLQQAEQAIREGDSTRAVLFLQQAYEVDPDPRYIANLGVVYERSGQYAAAADAFERYLAGDPEPSKRAAAESALARLRPEGVIGSRPSGALVLLDGAAEPAGRTPLRTRLLAGPHTVQLRLDGYHPVDRALGVDPGEAFQLDVDLRPLPAPDRRTAGLVAIGGGAVALGAAGLFAWLSADALDARDAAGDVSGFESAQDRANGFAWGAIGAGAVGLAAVGLGVAWLVEAPGGADAISGGIAPMAGDDTGDAMPGATLVPLPGGAAVLGRF